MTLVGETSWLRVDLYSHQGRLVDFVIVHLVAADGANVEVAKADCAHGRAHIHRFGVDGRPLARARILRPIDSATDVESAYDDAWDQIFDHWEENLRRWRRGR